MTSWTVYGNRVAMMSATGVSNRNEVPSRPDAMSPR